MFDLLGPLPTGTTVLEASAGTGKTHTIGALVTRYIAEDVATLDDLLVITFGRAASQELRDRVRGALVAAERAFTDGASGDPVHQQLMEVDPAEFVRRHQRLRHALVNFDAATIATTHQFCELVLRSLGVAADTDTSARFVESIDDVVTDVVDDLYLATFADDQGQPLVSPTDASALAAKVTGDAQAAIVDADPSNATAVARVDFARRVRDEVQLRKRRGGLVSYDDLLTQVRDALEQPDSLAAPRMRNRWSVVLVDEFQDTDPVQWDVLRRAFVGHATVVLIGDPKQAIYAFRGGDIVTYLDAESTAGQTRTLAKNWRSDAPLVDRFNRLLAGAHLGSDRIEVYPVTAEKQGSRLVGGVHIEPVRVRQVHRDLFGVAATKEISAEDARSFIVDDCARDIAALLASDAQWSGRQVRAGDVAVIVGRRIDGALVQRRLQALGIQAVLTGSDDVFATEAATAWLMLLRAMDAPHRGAYVRAAAVGPFFGVGFSEIASDSDGVTARVADALRDWAAALRTRGVAAVLEMADATDLARRVLREQGGERLITDIRHLGEVLHEVAVRDRLGLTALIGWFNDERAAVRVERQRRLESDAAAVQIVTIHGSKGLEYPIVYVPFAFGGRYKDDVRTAEFHDDAGRRSIDVARAGKPWSAHVAAHLDEANGEELRKFYVALTRAQSQVVLWWAPSTITPNGPLHRLLFGRAPHTCEVPARVQVPTDREATTMLERWQAHGALSVEMAEFAHVEVPAPTPSSGKFGVRRFDRAVDLTWRRTSYSGIIRAAESAVATVSSEPDWEVLDDEPADVAEPVLVDPAALAPIGRLPKGATFGSLVHAILEHADPGAADIGVELERRASEQLREWPVEVAATDLAEALAPVFDSPLGPLAEGMTLGQLPLKDRLRELEFEFPLAGGDEPHDGAEVRVSDLAPLLIAHLAEDDPLRPYAASLAAPELGSQSLRGYLSGSVDVVFRLPSGRFLIADYKTNVLGSGLPEDYEPDRLTEAMLHTHYPLQAILYSVVLHRYLRWRLPTYDPEFHLGGVVYLYLRGMTGPDAPGGVFSWSPPASLVVAISETLGGRRA